jgi:ribosome-binding factor A
MSPKKRPLRRDRSSLFDPDSMFGEEDSLRIRKPDRKVHRLCGQVARALGLALSAAADDVLRDLVVDSVEPAPDAGRLEVRVTLAAPREGVDPASIVERLERATGFLRSEIAPAIERRKVPQLAFRLRLGGEMQP